MMELRIELKENGGDRLRSIESDISHHNKSLSQKKAENESYNELAKKLNLATVSNEHRFLNNLNDANDRFDSIEEQQDKLQNQKTEESVARVRYEERVKESELELIYLRNNRSNIPSHISKIRDDMIKALELEESVLPFVGELIEVQDSQWQGAIERILHSFALSLLVESEYYDAVSEYVEQTNLKGKLVYLKINRDNHKERFVDIQPTSLLSKIEVKASSPLFDSLTAILKDRFDIPCVDNMDDFRRFKKALTIHGQFKTNLSRHEKDDRYDINNKRKWVLGWDNAGKLEEMQNEHDKELEMIAHIDSKISAIDKQLSNIQASRDNLLNILRYKSFEQIDG